MSCDSVVNVFEGTVN